MAKHQCRECDKIYDDNPRRCSECGNTILIPVNDEPEKINDSDLSMKQIKGENITEQKSLTQKIKDVIF